MVKIGKYILNNKIMNGMRSVLEFKKIYSFSTTMYFSYPLDVENIFLCVTSIFFSIIPFLPYVSIASKHKKLNFLLFFFKKKRKILSAPPSYIQTLGKGLRRWDFSNKIFQLTWETLRYIETKGFFLGRNLCF